MKLSMRVARTFYTCLFVILCVELNNSEIRAEEYDAKNVKVSKIITVDNGSNATFSPNGKEILYTKRVQGKIGNISAQLPALWTANVDGTKKKVLIERSYNGAWSPNGKRIAYCSGTLSKDPLLIRGEAIFIYDVGSKKKIELINNKSYCETTYLNWTKDGNNLFFDPNLIDLDTLKETDGRKFYCKTITNEQGYLNTVCNKNEWLKTSLNIVQHPRVAFYAQIRKPAGIWVINQDRSLARLLIEGNFNRVSLSSDFSAILYESVNNIYVAKLGLSKTLPPRTFRVNIDRKALLESRNPSSCYSVERAEKEIDGGKVWASVFEPKLNPLNNKIIGASEKWKGNIEFVDIGESSAVIKIVAEAYPITVGDIVANIVSARTPGGGKGCEYKYWTVLKAFE